MNDVNEWRRDLRQAWLERYWKLTVQNDLAYQGMQEKAEKEKAMAYNACLQREVDEVKDKHDKNLVTGPRKLDDPRWKLGILRRLLA